MGEHQIFLDQPKYVEEKFNEKDRKSILRRGDVLTNIVGASIGRTAVFERDDLANINQAVCLLRCRPEHLNNFFLSYLLNSPVFKDLLHDNEVNTARANLSLSFFSQLLVPTPPLEEQKRIVAILDEAFASIAIAKANTEKNLQNARAIFESYLHSVFTQRGEGWVKTTLGREIDLLAGFAFKSSQYTNSDSGVRLLRGDNIIQGLLRWDDVKRWPRADTSEYERYQLREGDVVLAMDRPWVKAGLKHAMIAEPDLPCLLVQRTARLRGLARIENRFLMYLIGSVEFTNHILGVQTGIGVPHISGQQIKDFSFLRPPLAEQRRISAKLDALREETQRLESIYQRKLAALEALKKSLLHRAFSPLPGPLLNQEREKTNAPGEDRMRSVQGEIQETEAKPPTKPEGSQLALL